MAKQKNNQDYWQDHLDQLEDEKSADTHFIRQVKSPKISTFFDADQDFYSSPMLEQVFSDHDEGQLSIDVFQTDGQLIVKATIAGVDPKDIDISIENDILTIRGERSDEINDQQRDYLYQECYWGKFSRSIILPTPINAAKVKAIIKNGILTITLNKVKNAKAVQIKVKEIE